MLHKLVDNMIIFDAKLKVKLPVFIIFWDGSSQEIIKVNLVFCYIIKEKIYFIYIKNILCLPYSLNNYIRLYNS